MKVLHMSPKSIYPTIDGGCVAMDNFLRLLALHFEQVDHLCIATQKHPFQEVIYISHLPENVNLITHFELDTKVKRMKLFSSLFTSKSYQLSRFYDTSISNFIKNKCKDYDFVFLEGVLLSAYIPLFSKHTKVFVRSHNVEFKIWETQKESTNNILKRWAFGRLARQIKEVELSAYKKVNGLIHISSADELIFRGLLPEVQQLTIPLSVSENSMNRLEASKRFSLNFGFIGAANWQPNVDAINCLIRYIFPVILKGFSMAKLYLAGHQTEELVPSDENVVSLGSVENVELFYDKIDFFLVPITSGSGLKIKVVEAICKGKFVIGSKLAFEGFEFLSSKFIAEVPSDYVKIISNLMSESIDFREIVKQQQEEILANFGQKFLIQKLKDFVY